MPSLPPSPLNPPPQVPLPIDALLARIAAAVADRGAVVVTAETGAGKTTRVPPALLDAGLAGGRCLVMLEPRRLAVRAAARRIAEERGVDLGDEVGYHVRFDRRAGARTQLLVVTEGILVRMLQEDPFLEQVGLLVFDEFHERSLDTDLSLALAARVRAQARPDLKLVVMSATLDAEPIAAFLGDAPVVASPGRLFPVEVEHRGRRRDERLDEKVAEAARDLLGTTDGDLLVFLPGVGEIRRAAETLAPLARSRDLDLLELHGELAPERQDLALEAGPRRRIVLATNVAETSVTLPRVTGVIDSGLVRRMRYDLAVGLDRLELGSISQASAEQRKGRAGRVAPGRCIRLWSALDHRGLAPAEEPEIRRVDLAGLVLQLLSFGETDLAAFPFFERPDAAPLARAQELLERLGATRHGQLTPDGRAMAALPVHPRLARLLLEASRAGVLERAALAAALLSDRDPFLREPGAAARGPGGPGGRRAAAHESDSDLLDQVAALAEFADRGTVRSSVGELHRGRAEFILRGAGQLVRSVRPPRPGEPVKRSAPRGAGADEDTALARALLAAFPDRLCRRREAGSPRGVMVGGRGVRLADESAVRRPELFLALDLDAGGEEALVRCASGVERSWLAAEQLATEDELEFDVTRETVVALRRTRFADLVLDERPVAASSTEAAAEVLAAAAARDPARALGLDRPELVALAVRIDRLAEWMPELGLARLDESFWRGLLPELCAGRRSYDELRRLPLVELARARGSHAQQRALDRHAPERLTVPSGSAIRLDYGPDGPPVLAARMQELFGLAETPRIADGRVPVLLHLLAPNFRPVQVTQDLASFWNNVYPRIRKELRAQYPRHSWPEDPWNAPPVCGPRRRG